MALKIFHEKSIRKSENWYFWILYIDIEEAYVKIAGAREQTTQTVYEMYSKHGRAKKEFETHDKKEFIDWFQASFNQHPFESIFPSLPEDITLNRHSKDSKRIWENTTKSTHKDLSIQPKSLIDFYRLK